MGDTANQKQHPYLYWEFVGTEPSEGGGPRQGVRSGVWKAVLNFGQVSTAQAGEGDIELYHLGDDPGETVNLAEQMPELAQRMRALLVQQILRGRSTPGTPQPNDGAPVWEAVRWMEDAK